MSPWEKTPSPEERAEFEANMRNRRVTDGPSWRTTAYTLLGGLLLAGITCGVSSLWNSAVKLDRLGEKTSSIEIRQNNQEIRMNNIDANVVRLCVKSGVEPVR